jgi:hypothetical protein
MNPDERTVSLGAAARRRRAGAAAERGFAWPARRRLARDDERLPETLAGLQLLAFAIPMFAHYVASMADYAWQAPACSAGGPGWLAAAGRGGPFTLLHHLPGVYPG